MNALKVVVVGCGRWGKNIIRTIAQLGSRLPLELDCVVHSGNEGNRNKTEGELGVRCSTNIDQALSTANAVIIATPDESHFVLAKRALAAKIPTFVEKPVANSLAETTELVDLATSNNTLLSVGHILAFHPCVEAIRTQVRESQEAIQSIYSSRMDAFRREAGKTVIRSSLVHDIAMIDTFLKCLPLSATTDCLGGHLPDPDHVQATLCFPNNVSVGLCGSSVWPHRQRDFMLWTDQRLYRFDGIQNNYSVYRRDAGTASGFEIESTDAPTGMALTIELEAFFTSVLNRDTPLLLDSEHIIRVMTIIDTLEKPRRPDSHSS